jgi:hypothetical protein
MIHEGDSGRLQSRWNYKRAANQFGYPESAEQAAASAACSCSTSCELNQLQTGSAADLATICPAGRRRAGAWGRSSGAEYEFFPGFFADNIPTGRKDSRILFHSYSDGKIYFPAYMDCPVPMSLGLKFLASQGSLSLQGRDRKLR